MDHTIEILIRLGTFAGLGLAIGFVSGLFGVGGGIVRIPVFIFFLPSFGVSQSVLMHVSIGTSVALVIPTAIVATRKQIRLGNLDVDYYRSWALGVFVGVGLGMALLPFVSTFTLQVIFTVFLVAVAIYVGFVKEDAVISTRPPTGWRKMLVSAGIGCASALTGTGGGAITTPTMKAFSYPLKQAIALASASGLVIGVVSTISVIAQGWNVPGRPSYSLGYVDLLVFIAMLPTTVYATPMGAAMSNSMSKQRLKMIYTALLFIVAANMAWKLFHG